jgi:hypothetical protein
MHPYKFYGCFLAARFVDSQQLYSDIFLAYSFINNCYYCGVNIVKSLLDQLPETMEGEEFMKKIVSMVLFMLLLFVPIVPALAKTPADKINNGPYRSYQGSRYYYNILDRRSYHTQRKAIYNFLAEESETLHNDFTTDYTNEIFMIIDLGNYFQRNIYGYFDSDVYQAVDETIAAFFDDNTQYCFLEKNAGTTENSWQYTIRFYQSQPTDKYPSLDFRNAADRRKMRDMIDATFQTYESLTKTALSKYEIARLVHDKIVSDWDYSAAQFTPGSHDLFGGMGYATDGIVCEAYSKMYAFLLNNLGVPAIFVAGDALASDGFAAGGHAWNIVEMDDGKNYFADLTWADNQRTNRDVGNYRNPIDYSWFLLGIDNGKFESKHYAGEGSFVGVYERPENMGGADYNYQEIHTDYQFLTDLYADRSLGLDLGTYHLPNNDSLRIQPPYYDTNLIYGTDYEVVFEKTLHLGKNRVWFVAKGDYRGSDFGVVNLVAENASIDLNIDIPAATYEYTGAEIRPVPIVKNGAIVLTAGIDYTVAYQNNIEKGTATIVITGTGTYTGTYEHNFQIITVSNGVKMTAAQFNQLYPTIKNALVVISKNDGSRISQNMHNDSLPYIQNAANYYGLPVYYIDCYEEDPTLYPFFVDMTNEFFRSGKYREIECYPLLGIFKDRSHFGVYAGSAVLASGGYYAFPFIFEEEIRNEIEQYIHTDAIEDNEPAPTSDDIDIAAAKKSIEQAAFSVAQERVGNPEEGKAVVETIINQLALFGVTVAVEQGTFTAAIAGSENNLKGTNGSYTFILRLSKGVGTTVTLPERALTMIATAYQPTVTNVFPIRIRAVKSDPQLIYGTWMKDNLAAALAPCVWKGDSSSAMPTLYSDEIRLESAGKYYFVLANAARWSLDGTCKAIEVTVDEEGQVKVQGYNVVGNTLGTSNNCGKISYDPTDPSVLVVSWESIPI